MLFVVILVSPSWYRSSSKKPHKTLVLGKIKGRLWWLSYTHDFQSSSRLSILSRHLRNLSLAIGLVNPSAISCSDGTCFNVNVPSSIWSVIQKYRTLMALALPALPDPLLLRVMHDVLSCSISVLGCLVNPSSSNKPRIHSTSSPADVNATISASVLLLVTNCCFLDCTWIGAFWFPIHIQNPVCPFSSLWTANYASAEHLTSIDCWGVNLSSNDLVMFRYFATL